MPHCAKMFLYCILLNSTSLLAETTFTTANLATTTSFLSDDGSEIRPMPSIQGVESVHCRLPKGGAIQASEHRTVSQIWYVISGKGELWLKSHAKKETVLPLQPGVAVTVPLGYGFQFHNTGEQDLDIFIVNTTKWSGAGELIPIKNHWPLAAAKPSPH